MRVVVENLYSEKTQIFEGSPEHVAEELMLAYPWLRSEDRGENKVENLVEQLALVVGIVIDCLDIALLPRDLRAPDDLEDFLFGPNEVQASKFHFQADDIEPALALRVAGGESSGRVDC